MKKSTGFLAVACILLAILVVGCAPTEDDVTLLGITIISPTAANLEKIGVTGAVVANERYYSMLGVTVLTSFTAFGLDPTKANWDTIIADIQKYIDTVNKDNE